MKIVIEDYGTFKQLGVIENPTASQVITYSTCNSLVIDGQKYIRECASFDHDTQILSVREEK